MGIRSNVISIRSTSGVMKLSSHHIYKGSNMKKLTQDQAISKCKEHNGDIYDYSKAIYTGSNNKIEIICKEHGSFWQNFYNHLNGYNCPKCSEINRRINCTKSTDEFIKEAIIIHKNKYIYSKVKYNKNNLKVIITCPIHGDFLQTPNDHLHSKSGCSKCLKHYNYT